MIIINDRQVDCMQDCISNGSLSRPTAVAVFGRHKSQTIYSLIKHGAFLVKKTTNENFGYPLMVIPNHESDLIKHVSSIGKKVTFYDPDKKMGTSISWPATTILGLAIKDGKVYFRWKTGSNYFTPVEYITNFITE